MTFTEPDVKQKINQSLLKYGPKISRLEPKKVDFSHLLLQVKELDMMGASSRKSTIEKG
jgi:hypothetical protein